jgi:hypothetical protein
MPRKRSPYRASPCVVPKTLVAPCPQRRSLTIADMPTENFSSIDPVLRGRIRAGLVAAVGLFADRWAEWGVIEFIYARGNLGDFAQAIDDSNGHRAQAQRGTRTAHSSMVSKQMSNMILSGTPGTDRIFGNRSGAWALWESNNDISYWAVDGLAEDAPRLTWAEFCVASGTGQAPNLPEMDYMEYVPP